MSPFETLYVPKSLFSGTTENRLFFDTYPCIKRLPNARTILTIRGLDNRLVMKNYACCIDWLEDVLRVLAKKVAADFFTTLWNNWNNWNNRNNYIFRGKEDEARVVWERAKTLSNEFCIHNLLNFDAAVAPNGTGYGMIARDKDGFVIGGGEGFKEEALTVEWRKSMLPRKA
ncbi:hypothetical protein CXB51_031546 [Gossypium anomalum]|uniref:Uncharacterized protein n=1 Tax=Gossypium anomalum TaxID=47600 RepID=A0A8J6CL41_9ROSI|nr:hypothetical protein CXB51_031546 [Gossypium anomalum]